MALLSIRYTVVQLQHSNISRTKYVYLSDYVQCV